MPWFKSSSHYVVQYRMDDGEWRDYCNGAEEATRIVAKELREAGVIVRLAKITVTLEPVEI